MRIARIAWIGLAVLSACSGSNDGGTGQAANGATPGMAGTGGQTFARLVLLQDVLVIGAVLACMTCPPRLVTGRPRPGA